MIKNKLFCNSITSLFLQIISTLIALIIPRFMLQLYGSNVNGLTQSITQFLNYIILLEAGVGGVILVALYKPINEKNIEDVAKIVRSSKNFFVKISIIFLFYLIFLSVIYPFLINNQFDFIYTSSLILIMGISIIFEYSLGATNKLILMANQKLYIYNFFQICALIINFILMILLIKLNVSIHILKLIVSIPFVLRPIILHIYVNRKYKIYKTKECVDLPQKWDAFGHHLAFFVHSNTDIVLLTFFFDFNVISIYSIYFLVTIGLSSFINSLTNGFKTLLGKFLSQKNFSSANKLVDCFEFFIFFTGTILFTSCAFLIVPFVKLYTNDITDINYINYSLGFLISFSSFVVIIRNFYCTIIYSAGEFKQTSKSSYIELLLNLIISIILLLVWGVNGVIIGTIVSMSFKVLYSIVYLKKHILYRAINLFIKFIICTFIIVLISSILYITLQSYFNINNFLQWIILAIVCTGVNSLITLIIYLIFSGKTIFKNIYNLKLFLR